MTKLMSAGSWAALALLATTAAFWPVTIGLGELWLDSNRPYSHGLLVAPIAVWLIYRACVDARATSASPSVLGVILFVVTTVMWLAAYGVDVLIGQEILLPVLLVLAVAAVAGWQMARSLLFPVGFVYFAVPIWSALTSPLQALTVGVVGFALDVVAIPAYVEGNYITIPEGVFEVAGGCSGLHFFIVALTVASLRSYLALRRFWPRLWLLLIAAGLAVLSNWIRVGSLVAIGHYSRMQHYLITHDHYYYGWVLFAAALVPLILAARYLERGEDDAANVSREFVARPALRSPTWRSADGIVAALFFLILAFPLTVISVSRGAASVGTLELNLPAGRGDWSGAATATSRWEPSYAGADGETRGAYINADRSIDAYIAVYLTQSQGRELVAERNRLFPRDHALRSQRTVVLGSEATPRQVREQVFETARGHRRIVWFWYAVGRRVVTRDFAVKLWQALDSMRGRDSAGIVAVSVECASDCASERGVLQAFLGSMGPVLASAAAEYHGRIVD